MKWFRWYHGTVDDRKWLVVSRHCGQSRAVVLAVWCALLEFASQAEERGSIADFDCESLDALLGVEDGVCAAVMQAFVRKGLVSGSRLTAWERRQPRREDEDAAERQRRRRQRLATALPPAREASPDSPADAGDTDAAETACSVISNDYDECHALSRTVAQCRAPEEDTEKIRSCSPPPPSSSPAPAADTVPPPRVDAVRESAPSPAEEGDMGFQQLVAAYPAAHVAPRAEALDIWQRLGRGNTRPGLPRLLQGLALWRESSLWRKEDGRYIPKLANFLRRRMWEDPPPDSGDDWKTAELRQRAYRARMNALLQEACHG